LSVGLVPENELSRMAGICIDGKTDGPIVNESMETSIPGIFACGNVVHVHDVVDFVTEESVRAGANAARLVSGEGREHSEALAVKVSGGITYCVPHKLSVNALPEKLDLFMRVDDIYEKAKIVIRNQGRELASFQKSYLTPGEMIKQRVDNSIFEGAKGEIEISLVAGGRKND